ncbi:unnamed protein product [Zymoseptoria tritici ST99CH_1E4]|uniref:Uncharacterized protein n=1 Tax=Zymoseptoria tritici ST99CH_1E4 TaxID=1276532 RepID=A0A2H1FXM5_ZYMTR|nr:unnamed protein product [Zymoseptoria tritici ST99CH_1E4]
MAPTKKNRAASQRNVLNTLSTFNSKQAITDRNSNESALLRLAPELRNRIAEFVLQPGSIHVYPTESGKPSFQVAICRHGVPEPEFFADSKLRDSEIIEDHDDRHSLCIGQESFADVPREVSTLKSGFGYYQKPRIETPERPSLALLQTCRQLNLEMRLLPFTGNNFVFATDTSSTFKAFMPKLTRPQRRAIRSISIITESCWPARNEFSSTLLPELTSVESLTVRIRNNVGQRWRGQDITAFKALEDLARLPLRSVSVVYWNVFGEQEELQADRTAQELRTFLLRDWADISAERKQADRDAKLAVQQRETMEILRKATEQGRKLRSEKSKNLVGGKFTPRLAGR